MDATLEMLTRRDFSAFAPPPSRAARLASIEHLADEIGRRAPEMGAQTDEILGLTASLRESSVTRDAVIEAIEGVCGEDLSGCCVSRIADAVMRLCAR